MRVKEYAAQKAKSTKLGARLVEDKRYRVTTKAVISLILNLAFAFYNGILGVLSSAPIFIVSALYYLLLSSMRFLAVLIGKKRHREGLIAGVVGVMLIVLSIILHVMVIVSMKYNTAAVYGTITMITIATYTFTKITLASITALKHRGQQAQLYKTVNAIRYSEVAVSLLTMQQSMLVSFGAAGEKSTVILNACTGAGVCFLILALGIITLKNSRKEKK